MIVKSGYKSINGDYIFAKTAEMVKEYKRTHPKIRVIDLGVGDVKMPIFSGIAKAMKKAVADLSREKTFSGYPPDEGYLFLREAISRYYERLGCEVLADEIFITSGAKPSIADLVSLADFDCAFVPQPNYPLYLELCEVYGIKSVTFDGCPQKYLKMLKSSQCDLCFLCSPCNPTGEKLDDRILYELCRYEKNRGGAVILDGAYAFFDDQYRPPFLNDDCCSSLVEVRTCSKSLSFTGVRCGYTVIKKQNPLYEPFSKLLSLRYNGVNVTAQRAAVRAFYGDLSPEFHYRKAYYRKNAEVLAAPFVRRGYTFSGGICAPYVFAESFTDGERFANLLLENYGVCVTPGEGFGGKNRVRLSCLCTAEDADEGALRIGSFLDRYAPKNKRLFR